MAPPPPCTTSELHKSGGIVAAPELRVRGLRGLMRFNGLPFERARAIDSCVAATHPTAALYKLCMKRLMFNLASNPALHDMPCESLVFASDDELARGTIVERVQAQERARHEAFIRMLNEKRDAVERLVDPSESLLHCRKCGSANLNFLQLQLRSADEPMSCFLTCNACGNRWRMT